MSLLTVPIFDVPELTAQIARVALPLGRAYKHLAESVIQMVKTSWPFKAIIKWGIGILLSPKLSPLIGHMQTPYRSPIRLFAAPIIQARRHRRSVPQQLLHRNQVMPGL